MTDDAEPLQRLAAYLERRIAELGLEYAEVARLAGFSIEVLRKMRHGITVRLSTYRKLERSLRWEHGSVEAILSGRDPIPLAEDPPVSRSIEHRAAREAEEASAPHTLSPSEALRRIVRASAKELGMTPDDVGEAMQLARQDLEGEQPAPSGYVTPSSVPGRTDLSDMVRERRLEIGLSLHEAAERAVDPETGDHVMDAAWLDRLERDVLGPKEYPEYNELDALAVALSLNPGDVQEAAGRQFLDVHSVWSEDGQVRAVIAGEPSPEDLVKLRTLMRLYRRAPSTNQ